MNKPKKIGSSIYFSLILFLELFYSSGYSQFSLVGNTTQTAPTTYRLTQDVAWQNGSLWNTTKIDLTSSFDLFFELYLGNHDNGADGISFTLQQKGTNAGSAGGGMGIGGVKPSVIVEYDTWNNTPYDLVADHIAIEKNGDVNHSTTNNLAGPVSANAAGTDIENGQWHRSRVKWNASTKTLEVYFDCTLRLSYTGDIVANVFGGNPNVYYGFTAATGGSTNEQSVRDFYFTTEAKKLSSTICLGSSYQIDLPDGDTYSWTPAIGISSSTAADPIFNPTTTTRYIATVNNCIQTWKDTVDITVVNPPVVDVADKTICAGTSTTFDAGNAGSTFVWSGLGSGSAQTTSASAAGTYTVNVTDVNGCKASDNATLTVNALPVVSIANKAICSGTSTTFDAGNVGSTFVWSGNGTGTSQTTPASTAGTYTVTVTNAANCSATGSATLTLNALPVVNIADKAICTGSSTTFDAGNAGSSFVWSGLGSGTSQTTLASAAGTYTVIVTNGNGCQASDNATLTVNTLPVVNLGPDKNICPGNSTTLDAGSGFSYLWNNGSSAQTLLASAAGNYSVTITDANGCQSSDNLTVTMNSNLIVDLGADKAICQGDAAITFDAGNTGSTYLWNNGSSNQTLAANTAGTYSVNVTDINGCTGSGSVNLIVNTLPVVDIADKTICDGNATTFDAGNAGSTFVWSALGSGTSQTTPASKEGTYTVTVTNGNGCKASDNATLTLNSLPVVNVSDKSVCAGSSTTFDAGNTGSSFVWSGVGNGTSQTTAASVAGIYSVTVTNANGCKASDNATLTVNNLPIVNLTDQSVCKGLSTIFDAGNAGSSFVWSGLGSGTVQTNSASDSGVYIVTVTDANGCKASDSATLTVNPLPVVTISDKIICSGTSTTFDAENTGSTFVWSGSGNGTSQSITASTAGIYSVSVTDGNGCKNSDDATLSFYTSPKPNLGADRNICPGMSTTIDAGNWTSYLWNNSSTAATYSTSDSGSVFVSIKDTNGCEGSDTINISISNNLTVSLGPDKVICANADPVTFDAGISPATYVWNSGENTQNISKNIAGTFSVVVTTPDGCTGKDSVVLSTNSLPLINIDDQTICAGSSAIFNAGNFKTYKWNNDSTSKTLSVASAGKYWVEVTDTNGCKNTDTVSLKINQLPVITLNNKSTCEGQIATLDAGAGFTSYQWTSGENTRTLSSALSGTFTVTVSDSNSCQNSASATITIHPKPIVNLSSFTPVCANTPNFKLNGGIPTGGKYKTLYNSLAVETDTFNTKIMGMGSHPVIYVYTDIYGCENSAQAAIPVNGLPLVSMNDKTICAGETTFFDAGADFVKYNWNNGSANTQQISASTAGTYFVTVTDANGCTNKDTATLNVNPLPVVNLGADKTVCEGNPFSISSDINAADYLWSTGAKNQSININASGKYSITVTDAKGCKGYDEMEATIIPVPVIELGDDIEICEGQSTTINSNLNSGKLLWSTGEFTKSIQANKSSNIKLKAFYDSQCPVYDSLSVTVISYPVSKLFTDTVVCFNEIQTLTLDAGNDAEHYLWDDGNTSSSISISKEGKYTVSLTNGGNCTVNDTVKIKELCSTELYVPDAFTPFNKDGINDIFYVKGTNVFDFHLMIFDRWGELIYESYNMDEGWDGTYKGNAVQMDVYVWKLHWKGNAQGNEKFNNQRFGSVSVIK